jgi:DNA-binding transcriptional MerR regulator
MPNKNSKTAIRYNIFRTAEKLGVHERSVRYWIKKGWITPHRDYRNYPVFTDSDIEKIREWRNTLRG